jgi:hypothetical protein
MSFAAQERDVCDTDEPLAQRRRGENLATVGHEKK